MDLMEGLLTRRSVRQYDADRKVSREDIEEILKAASYAPSAHNKQPWEFLVIEDPAVMAGFRSVQPWTSFAKTLHVLLLSAAILTKLFIAKKIVNIGILPMLTVPWLHKICFWPVMPKV